MFNYDVINVVSHFYFIYIHILNNVPYFWSNHYSWCNPLMCKNKKSINKMGVGGARINQKYVFGRIFPNWLKRSFIMHRTQIATKGTYFIQIKKFFSWFVSIPAHDFATLFYYYIFPSLNFKSACILSHQPWTLCKKHLKWLKVKKIFLKEFSIFDAGYL